MDVVDYFKGQIAEKRGQIQMHKDDIRQIVHDIHHALQDFILEGKFNDSELECLFDYIEEQKSMIEQSQIEIAGFQKAIESTNDAICRILDNTL